MIEKKIFSLDSEANRKRRLGKDDESSRRKRRDLPRLENYDRCCKLKIEFDKTNFLFSFLVWNIWEEGRKPQRATLKHGSIYDYYDILEEIGR